MARPGNQHCANCSGTLGKLTHPLLYLFCLNILLTYTLQCIYLVAWRTCISLSVHDAAKCGDYDGPRDEILYRYMDARRLQPCVVVRRLTTLLRRICLEHSHRRRRRSGAL